MVQVVVESDGYLAASRDTDRAGSSVELVAPDVVGSHVADEAIVLPVLGLADGSPLWSSVDDGNGVCNLAGILVSSISTRP